MQEAGFHLNSSKNQLVAHFEATNSSLYIKREDLIDPFISGNKFRKLKYNLAEASKNNFKTILTFGGAFSNHIAATAAAGKRFGFKSIGIIRGEELGDDLAKTLQQNATLSYANSCGMQLEFVSREVYKNKAEPAFIQDLESKYGEFYLIPEGGTNELAIKGCEEILKPEDQNFNFICCPVGTGGTIAGIINSASPHQNVIGFPALKGDWLASEIEKYTNKENWQLNTNYHFGGYAKTDATLISFINNFRKEYQIPLDPVYTGKMLFGIFDMIQSSGFPQNSRILAVHTGGLQGIEGMNKMLSKKNLPLLDV